MHPFVLQPHAADTRGQLVLFVPYRGVHLGMTTFMKEVLVVDNCDTEESKQYRFCLAAAMQSYNKQLSDAQRPDDTSFESFVTMLAKLLRCHGRDVVATNERAVVEGWSRRRIYTTKAPIQQLAFALCHDRYGERTKNLLARMFHGSGPCIADRSIAALVTDKLLEACTLLQEDTSDEKSSRSKRARSRSINNAGIDSDDKDESNKVLGSTQHTSWSKRAQLKFATVDTD
jgi:hypothetical protein